MSSDDTRSRLNTLLTKVDEHLKNNQLPQAAESLREASHLDADNPQVRDRWIALHNRGGASGDVRELIRKAVTSEDDFDIQSVVQALRQTPLSSKEASQAVELLLHSKRDDKAVDAMMSTLILSSIEARKAVAMKLSAKPTATFELLLHCGKDTMNAFAGIPVEDALWSNMDQERQAERDVLQLCVAALIRPGAGDLQAVVACIARLFAFAPDAVAPLVDEDMLGAILESVDIRSPDSLRSQALLAISKLLEATKQRGEQLFSEWVTTRVGKGTYDDLILVFSAAAAVFPIIPTVTAGLFLTDGFVQRLVPNLGQMGKRKSHSLELAALQLLSAACVDSACREAIKRYCMGWLETLVDEREGEHEALAALVLAKIGAGAEDDDDGITAKLEELILNDDHESDQAIEGLAYSSLRPSAKEMIANNNELVKRLVTALKERSTATFGCLTVFDNLTRYRPNLSEEGKKVTQLKAYANASRPVDEDPLDDPVKVTARCRKLLDVDIVAALVECSKRIASPTNISLIIHILLGLAKEQKHRPKMAQQGAVRLLLQYLAKASPNQINPTERTGAHALARLLISLNPDHIFSAALPASNAVGALAMLLSPESNTEQRDLLPAFEALLALTNLASMEDDSIRELEIRLVWSRLEDELLLSSNKLIQRASMELVCNLMASPTCVAKFIGDGSKREATRMQILLALTDAEDLPTRRAAGGALATLTEWDAAVVTIMDQNKAKGLNGIATLLKMCDDDSDEMKHRGLVCVENVVNAPGDVGKRGVQLVEENDGKEVIQQALKTSRNQEVLNIGVAILKRLV